MAKSPRQPELFTRSIEDYDTATIRHFADEIIYYESSGENDNRTPDCAKFIGYGIEVDIFKQINDDNDIAYYFYINDTNLTDGRSYYLIPADMDNVFLYDEDFKVQFEFAIDDGRALMEYLRLHPFVKEPMLDEDGRETFDHVAASFAVDKAIKDELIDIECISQDDNVFEATRKAADVAARQGVYLEHVDSILPYTRSNFDVAAEINARVVALLRDN